MASEQGSGDDRRHILNESFDSSTATLVQSPNLPSLPARHRPGYQRIASIVESDDPRLVKEHEEEKGDDIADTFDTASASRGLGIATTTFKRTGGRVLKKSISQLSVAGAASPGPSTGGTAQGSTSHLISSPKIPRYVAPKDTSYGPEGHSVADIADIRRSHWAKPSVSSLRSGFGADESTDDLMKKHPTPSIRSAYDNFSPSIACPSHKRIYQGVTWLSGAILALSIYSTVMSGLYLVIAFMGLRYGRWINTKGSISHSNASLLTAFFAKTIELSYVTVVVAFLGQVLSRRAFIKHPGKGVTLAQMSMRSWIIQPGTLITHFETVRYAALSFLGVLSLFAALCSMLYTTSAEALVQPKLKFGSWEYRSMQGLVKSSFANPTYLTGFCQTPVTTNIDKEFSGSTCLQIEHSAQGYHNYRKYLGEWQAIARSGNGSSNLSLRPRGYGLHMENTSVIASWVEVVDMEENFKLHGRIVHNVSMAMPHSGIFQAARDPSNGIMQPEELDGLGAYSIRASVPSPVVNVLCANVSREDLVPIVYQDWESSNSTSSLARYQESFSRNFTQEKALNTSTPMDDIFNWGPKTDRPPPIFPRYPIDYNTVLNATTPGKWGRDSIYLLAKGGSKSPAPDYMLCSIQVYLTPHCSTRYNASGTGGSMEAICENKDDDLAYIRSLPATTTWQPNRDWVNVADGWAKALALSGGLFDANASNARLLTQLIPQSKTGKLNPMMPSPAEALAVMAGCTLLRSAQDTPFVHFWNYTAENNMLNPGQYEPFKAAVRAQQYASGGVDPRQGAFYIILAFVFASNLFVLAYFVYYRGFVTDFSEPPNLFSLSINSPPSQLLAGSCGGGPEGNQYRVPWFVNVDGEHVYMESGEEAAGYGSGSGTRVALGRGRGGN